MKIFVNFKPKFLLLLPAVVITLLLSFGIFWQQAKANALTQEQINAIVTLLQSFGTDHETINKVKSALEGKVSTQYQVASQENSTSKQLRCPNIARSLQKGMKGQDVSELQIFLKKQGFFTYPEITNYFGEQTVKAVRAFQCAKLNLCSGNEELNGYGTAGPKTRAKIQEFCNTAQNETYITGTESGAQTVSNDRAQRIMQPPNITRNLYLGVKGDDVKALQVFLKNTGYFNYPEITGYYGNATKQAVQKFQCDALSICSGDEITTGYGVAGPKTREAISSYGNTASPSEENVSIAGNGHADSDTVNYSSSCSISNTTLSNGESRFFYLQDRSTNCDLIKQTRVCQNGELSGDPRYVYLTCDTVSIGGGGGGSSSSSSSSSSSGSSYNSCTFNGQTVAHGSSVTAYQSATVPSGQTCQSQTRTCNDGVLSGTYNYASCSVEQPSCVSLGMNTNSTVWRRSLMNKREGYGASSIGGYFGDEYIVTSNADSGPGTLRDALSKNEPLWITFDKDMVINLKSNIISKSKKTIDGRGHNIILKNYGLVFYGNDGVPLRDIIVTNITIKDGAHDSVDAISIARANKIWIDHVTLSNFKDGLLDITNALYEEGSRVTITNSKFLNHNKVSIVGLHNNGSAIYDNKIYVTYARNYFDKSTVQRHPRVARATVHFYNNVVHWGQYGLASFDNARVYSERNWYIADSANKMATKCVHGGRFLVGPNKGKEIPDGSIKSDADSVLGGAEITTCKPNMIAEPYYTYNALIANSTNMSAVIEEAGAHSVQCESL